MSIFQHPGDKLDTKAISAVDKDELKAAMETEIGINKTGGIGYISGQSSLADNSNEDHNNGKKA